jgi:hypothetical protein
MAIKSWIRRGAGFLRNIGSRIGLGPHGGTPDPHEARAERILAEIEAAELATGDPFGLHEITKKLDIWFGIEAGRLERDARHEAVEWARAGLPRPGVDGEELPVESRLAARAAELYRKWARLLQIKVQDGIASATRRAGHAIIQYGEHLAALRRTRTEVDATKAEIAATQAHAEAQPPLPGATRHLQLWKFWGLITLLILVDWVANVPIFQELLPREAGADELWATIIAQSESRGALGGIYRVWMRVFFTPDVSVLALGVIAFLVFLAHVSGDAARHLVALGRMERHEGIVAGDGGVVSWGGGVGGGTGQIVGQTAGAGAIRRASRGRRRQFLIPLVAGFTGAVAVVAVLYMARERIKAESDARLAEAVEEVRLLEAELDAANQTEDLAAISHLTNQLPRARAQVDDRRARAQYATGIQAMNIPITGLNLILIIASALASYLAANVAQTEGRLALPRMDRLEARLKELSGEEARYRVELRELAEKVQAELGHADHLLHSRPLRGADEKAKRLQSLIALFRAENARERGIDPATIQAFRKRIELDLPEPEAAADLMETPAELLRYQDEFRRLRERYVGVYGEAEYAEGGGQ